jgi:formylglycine-generating enzyme required for sulfatase activity/predicted Ser/Thr protein kinase
MATNDGTTAGRAPDALPEVFGRYRVKRKLGGGGMGTVYLVENTELQREEALKVPRFEADDAEGRERFLREARAAAKLHHPNLCPVYHVGVQDGVSFLTMHYLQGKPLSDYTDQPQPPREAVQIVGKLAQALEYAHGQGVIHRDLKPSNVLMCAGVGPVVLDFGLAKQLRQTDRKLTQTGAVMGTPAYMSPEQVKGEVGRIGPASDVYSLGVILYELLTGQPLFGGSSVAEVFGKILYAEPLPPSALRPGLGPALDAICRKVLARTPEERYPSMKAFGAALADYLRADPATEGAGKLAPSKAERADLLRAATVPPSQARDPSPARRDQTAAAPVGARAGRKGQRSRRPWGVLVGLLGCLGLLVVVVGTLIGLGMGGFFAGAPSTKLADSPRTAPSQPVAVVDSAPSHPISAETKRTVPPPPPPPVATTVPEVGGARPALLDCTRAEGVSAPAMKAAQEAWATYLGRQVEEEDEIAPGIKIKFVLVPPGKFLMGSSQGETDHDKDEVQHEVTLTQPFYLGKYEVTQAQYEALLGKDKNPSEFKAADLPVESVDWTEADAYRRKLTKQSGGKLVYRLPTEAEWEYSCRGGRPSSQPFGIGNGTYLSSAQANFDGNFPYGSATKGEYLRKTSCVGSYPPNPLGLHDMHGNVHEWCADWYEPYPAGKVTNPGGPLAGSSRVFRGGSWRDDAGYCRAASRDKGWPGFQLSSLGVRLARVPSGVGK